MTFDAAGNDSGQFVLLRMAGTRTKERSRDHTALEQTTRMFQLARVSGRFQPTFSTQG